MNDNRIHASHILLDNLNCQKSCYVELINLLICSFSARASGGSSIMSGNLARFSVD